MILYVVYMMLTYSGCNVIHTHKECHIMERVGVRHRYSGCDVTNIVNMLLYTMDMMSSYVVDEIS